MSDPMLSIGKVAKRVGCNVSAIRFYADEGLVPSVRSNSGHRYFARSCIRRVSFILICQRLGYSLKEIKAAFEKLPRERTPNKADWRKLSRHFRQDIDQRIAELQQLKTRLTGCIGCGCLSMQACALRNPEDELSEQGWACFVAVTIFVSLFFSLILQR